MQNFWGKNHWAFGLGLVLLLVGTGLGFLFVAWGWLVVTLGTILIVWDRFEMSKNMETGMDQWIKAKEYDQNEKTIRILSRYRHDWMNDFQILIGNLRLQKYDVIEGFIQKVIQKAKDESKITRLDDVPLVIYLLGFNALHDEMTLSVDIKDTVKWDGSPISKEFIHQSIKHMVEIYRRHALHNEYENNLLYLVISMDDHVVQLSFTYQGNLDEHGWRMELDGMQQKLHQEGSTNAASVDLTPSEMVVHFPYAAT
jgi:stage 0 sporulation protein B (sporulation initiation phosphotransferase)